MKIEVHAPTIRRKEMDAVLSVLVDEKVGPGPTAVRLIQNAKDALGFRDARAFRSPATALWLALRLFGDDAPVGVLVSALSPRYYAAVIAASGLTPVVADVEEATGCVSGASLAAALEKAGIGCRCAVLSETLGMIPDFPSIVETGLSVPIIEDCSAAFGSTLDGKSAGTFGTLGILGLEERDVLTAGGGAVLYALDKRSATVLAGQNTPPEVEIPDMNAALALTQLREARRNQARRGEIASIYADAALRCRHRRFALPSGAVYNDYAFALVVEEGLPAVISYAERKGVAVERAFTNTLAGSGLVERERCPVAASLALRTALFPLYPRLSATSIATVARLIQTLP